MNYRSFGNTAVGVDFNGTLGGVYPSLEPLNEEVVRGVRCLKRNGIHIVIHTGIISSGWGNDVEAEKQRLADFLTEHKVPFDDIWSGIGKPYCALGFIDDNVYRYEPGNMDAIVKEILRKKRRR